MESFGRREESSLNLTLDYLTNTKGIINNNVEPQLSSRSQGTNFPTFYRPLILWKYDICLEILTVDDYDHHHKDELTEILYWSPIFRCLFLCTAARRLAKRPEPWETPALRRTHSEASWRRVVPPWRFSGQRLNRLILHLDKLGVDIGLLPEVFVILFVGLKLWVL